MTVYADETYYTSTYLGTSIASADYPRLSARASQWIDRLTHGRAASDTTNTDAIKMAMCAVADELQDIEDSGGVDGIQSESIGSSSWTYAANSAKNKPTPQRLLEAAELYLYNTTLLFAGFADGEYSGDANAV